MVLQVPCVVKEKFPTKIWQLTTEAPTPLVTSHREGFGLVGLEAMACGAGLVTTAVGGMKTYTEHQHNAWVVEPRTKSIADGCPGYSATLT